MTPISYHTLCALGDEVGDEPSDEENHHELHLSVLREGDSNGVIRLSGVNEFYQISAVLKYNKWNRNRWLSLAKENIYINLIGEMISIT